MHFYQLLQTFLSLAVPYLLIEFAKPLRPGNHLGPVPCGMTLRRSTDLELKKNLTAICGDLRKCCCHRLLWCTESNWSIIAFASMLADCVRQPLILLLNHKEWNCWHGRKFTWVLRLIKLISLYRKMKLLRRTHTQLLSYLAGFIFSALINVEVSEPWMSPTNHLVTDTASSG